MVRELQLLIVECLPPELRIRTEQDKAYDNMKRSIRVLKNFIRNVHILK